ncbi:MAG: hypothetical protein ACXWHZ_15745 [Usitatibacter sp.]
MNEQINQMADGILKDIRLSPRPEDLRSALERVGANPTEFLRAFQWNDRAELGRLLAHELDNALLRRADKEARELYASMNPETA